MKRRDALAILAGLSAAALARGESPSIRRVGILLPAKVNEPVLKPYRERLATLGWTEGRNLAIEVRNAEGNLKLAPSLATELVQLKCDVIVAATTPLALATKQATSDTPVVFVLISDPVGSGLVTSLNRPGGNLTGLSNLVLEIAPKQLELLKALDPRMQRAAVLADARSPSTRGPYAEVMARAAARLGVSLLDLDARSADGIGRAFETAAREHATAMIVAPSPQYGEQRALIARLALRHRVATAFQVRSFVAAGGLVSYGTDPAASFLRSAAYVDKILRGAKPADLPVEQADRFELVLNRRTAKELGLTVPQTVLLQATELIE